VHVRSVVVRNFKRFSDLTIEDIPATARLVVLVGPNGSGKSSLFDAFMVWHGLNGRGAMYESTYHDKVGFPIEPSWAGKIRVEFHEGHPLPPTERRDLFYFRSPYRNQSDFSAEGIQRVADPLEEQRFRRMIDSDISVAANYRRAVSAAVGAVFDPKNDEARVTEVRETLVGPIRDSMSRVFGDLRLAGLGDPLGVGTFVFDKGASAGFLYKNLSAGEKAAFDLLLDLHIMRTTFTDTVYCIDEPESHLHATLQSALLAEMRGILPDRSQLWIATHSVGMLRAAQELWAEDRGGVVFLDFMGRDFDAQVTMRPAAVNRQLWKRHFDAAIGDIAELVAPDHVILCEGAKAGKGDRDEFDARCYRAIFGESHPDVEFISAGNHHEVAGDLRGLAAALTGLLSGIIVTRLLDRDDMSPVEIAQLEERGVRVLPKRHLEAYLLDDAVLEELCRDLGHVELIDKVLEIKESALADSRAAGRPLDDLKAVKGQVYVGLKKILPLSGRGNSADAFLSDTLAPLMPRAVNLYKELEDAVFGALTPPGT